MAANKSLIICFIALLSLSSFSVYGGSELSRLNARAVMRAKVLAVLEKELTKNVREKTGKNDGEDVEKYLASVGQKKGAPWCAAFVVWVLKEAGVNTGSANAFSPSCFPKNKTIYDRKAGGNFIAAPTDLFGLYYPNLGRIGHVGFIYEVNENSIITVEGNTNGEGSREGNGVYKRRRLKRTIHKIARWI
jgi:hypothetical protein